VAVDVTALKSTRSRIGGLRLAGTEKLALTGMIVASFALRVVAAVPHSTPRLFPDEYIYAALARSLAHGHLTIRGAPAHFPALLEPLLAAPLWLHGSVNTGFRLTQGMHALVASMIAVPVWFLAVRVGLPRWQRLMAAAVTLTLPLLLYSSYLTADIAGATFAVSAVTAAVVALETATKRWQGAFLLLAALATFARVQYVIIFAAFVCAAPIVSGGPLRALSRYRATAVALVLPVAALALVGPSRALGYYQNILHLHVDAWAMARWSGSDLMLLAYASGFVLVPGALAGLALCLGRPRNEAERGLGAFVAPLAVLLLLEASLYASNGSGRFQERYLAVLLPLVPVLFFLGSRPSTGRSRRLATAAAAFALLILAARVPLSGYTVGFGSQDSPLLQAVFQLEQLTSTGTGTLIVGLLAGGLALLAAFAVARPRPGVALSAAAAIVVLTAASIASVATDSQRTSRTKLLFPADARWVDHAAQGPTRVLVTPGNLRAASSAALFWNTSLTDLLQMGDSEEVDAFGQTPAQVNAHGQLLAAGKPVVGPVLVEEYASNLELTNATLVRRVTGATLWRVNARSRLELLTYGRYLDGWLAWPSTRVTVWPGESGTRRGTLCLTLTEPAGVASSLTLRGPGVRRALRVEPGSSRVVALPVSATRPWQLEIAARIPNNAGGRPVTVQSTRPRLITGKASASACR
jgi:hypothetical protein